MSTSEYSFFRASIVEIIIFHKLVRFFGINRYTCIYIYICRYLIIIYMHIFIYTSIDPPSKRALLWLCLSFIFFVIWPSTGFKPVKTDSKTCNTTSRDTQLLITKISCDLAKLDYLGQFFAYKHVRGA